MGQEPGAGYRQGLLASDYLDQAHTPKAPGRRGGLRQGAAALLVVFCLSHGCNGPSKTEALIADAERFGSATRRTRARRLSSGFAQRSKPHSGRVTTGWPPALARASERPTRARAAAAVPAGAYREALAKRARQPGPWARGRAAQRHGREPMRSWPDREADFGEARQPVPAGAGAGDASSRATRRAEAGRSASAKRPTTRRTPRGARAPTARPRSVGPARRPARARARRSSTRVTSTRTEPVRRGARRLRAGALLWRRSATEAAGDHAVAEARLQLRRGGTSRRSRVSSPPSRCFSRWATRSGRAARLTGIGEVYMNLAGTASALKYWERALQLFLGGRAQEHRGRRPHVARGELPGLWRRRKRARPLRAGHRRSPTRWGSIAGGRSRAATSESSTCSASSRSRRAPISRARWPSRASPIRASRA